MKNDSPVTLAIVLMNAVMFLASVTVGEAFVSAGVMDFELVSGGQLYRLLTAMFLHGSIDHIVGNMLFLFAMGEMVERAAGHVKYAVIYILAGIAGNAVSYLYEMISGIRYSSLGASGAVYGIFGALIVMSIKKVSGINIVKSRIPLAIIYCLYSSFAMPNIDYAAHIGGLLFGMLLTALLVKKGGGDDYSEVYYYG